MTRLTDSQRSTLEHLRDARALGMSALSFQQLADLFALRDQGLAKLHGPSTSHGVWRPVKGDVWSAGERLGGPR